MSPQEIAASLSRLGKDQLAQLDHASLYNARQYVPKEQQNLISPYEHRAFAREATAENPWMALPIAMGTLAYQPYKALMGQSRSSPSLSQVGQGMIGVGEGEELDLSMGYGLATCDPTRLRVDLLAATAIHVLIDQLGCEGQQGEGTEDPPDRLHLLAVGQL